MARFVVLMSILILLTGVALALPVRDLHCVFPTADLARYLTPQVSEGGFHRRGPFDAFRRTSDIPAPWAASMIPITRSASFQSSVLLGTSPEFLLDRKVRLGVSQ
ncbi:MAG: hypothetical protein WA637_22915 [Terriglobales bacterium]